MALRSQSRVKCNREIPCEACIKAGDAATCSYVSQGPQEASDLSTEPAQGNVLEARIDRLESLLMSVAANEKVSVQTQLDGHGQRPSARRRNVKSPSGGDPKDSDAFVIDEVSRALGLMRVYDDQERSHYIGASHWVTIGLSEIAEFRTYLRENHKEIEREAFEHRDLMAATPQNTTSLLKGTTPPASKEEILSWIPPRIIADELISRYFEMNNPTMVLLHQPTFRQEYAEFWADPSKATFDWLGLIFSLFRIAELQKELADFSSDLTADHFDLVAMYRRLTIQCLAASDYTNPTTNVMKTMLFYIECEMYSTQDGGIEISCVLGIAIRLAMKMGLHREWKAHAELSPFHAEMRRRLWACLHCLDIIYSLQVSLPSTIRQEDCDCEPPRNIRDEDFDRHSKAIPPSRPSTDVTEVSYLIAKRRLVLTVDRVLKATEVKGDLSRDEIRKLEDAMLSSRNAIPPYFQMTFATKAGPISYHLKNQRVHLDRLVHLSQCVLYRRFLSRGHNDEKLMHYRRSCIDSALALLSQQADLYTTWGASVDTPISIRKRHLFSLTSQDFFLAGMCIAIDLHYGLKEEPKAPKSSDIRLWGFDRRPEMIAALERSAGFWGIAKGESVEAAKAWGLFTFTVKTAKETLGQSPSQTSDADFSPVSLDVAPYASGTNGKGIDVSLPETLEFDWV